MKNLLKEIGKYFFDVSKILLAIAVITPYIKHEPIDVKNIAITGLIFIMGAIFHFQGGKDE